MTTIHLPITSLFASVFLVLLVLLALLVIFERIGSKTSFEHGGNSKLMRRIRAHGNYVEYVPIGLLALALMELQGCQARWIWILGGVLLAGRLLHILALMSKVHLARQIGMLLTFAMLLGSAWMLLCQSGVMAGRL